MSEFTAIIDLIGKVVTFIIERTADVIAITFLIGACVLPWRICEFDFDKVFISSDWRFIAVAHFFLTVFDCIAVPLGLISLISPIQWLMFPIVFNHHHERYGDTTHRREPQFELRFDLIHCFFSAILDWIMFAALLFVVVIPFRCCIVMKGVCYYLRLLKRLCDTRHEEDHCSFFRKCASTMRKMVVGAACHGVMNLLFMLVGTPFLIACPSLWSAYVKAIKGILASRPVNAHSLLNTPLSTPLALPAMWSRNYSSKHVHRKIGSEYVDSWDVTMTDLSATTLVQAPFAIKDFCACVFAMFALLSPLRHGAFLAAVAPCFAARPASSRAGSGAGSSTVSEGVESGGAGGSGAAGDEMDGPTARIAALREQLSLLQGRLDQQQQQQQQQRESAGAPGSVSAGDGVATGGDSEADTMAIVLQISTVEAEISSLSGSVPGNDNSAALPNSAVASPTTIAAATTGDTYTPPVAPLYYDYYLRQQCFYFGATALVDVLFIPVLVPLLVTWYRIGPVWHKLFPTVARDGGGDSGTGNGSGDGKAQPTTNASTNPSPSTNQPPQSALWGVEEYVLVVRQFILLFVDACLLLPLGIILRITCIRWRPVGQLLANPSKNIFASWSASWFLYGYLPRQMCLLVLDILVLPFALFSAIVGWYRWDIVQKTASNDAIRHSELFFHHKRGALRLHLSILCTSLLVFCDVVLLLPMALCVLLSGYRTTEMVYVLRDMWRSSFTSADAHAQPAAVQDQNNATSAGYASVSASESASASAAPSCVEGDSNASGDIQPGRGEAACARGVVQNNGLVHYHDTRHVPVYTSSLNQSRSQQSSLISATTGSGSGGGMPASQISSATPVALAAPPLTPDDDNWRYEIMRHFLGLLLDVPFFAIGLVVIATLWRASILVGELYFVSNEYRKYRRSARALIENMKAALAAGPTDAAGRFEGENLGGSRTFNSASHLQGEIRARRSLLQKMGNRCDSARRWMVLSQFMALLRDILSLIPFAFVTVTLYRLPNMLTDLYSELRTGLKKSKLYRYLLTCCCGDNIEGGEGGNDLGNLNGEAVGPPLYTVADGSYLEYPEIGCPVIMLKLRRNPEAISSAVANARSEASATASTSASTEANTTSGPTTTTTTVRTVLLPPNSSNGKPTTTVQLHLNFSSAERFWSAVGHTLGGLVASVGKQFLPLVLPVAEEVGFGSGAAEDGAAASAISSVKGATLGEVAASVSTEKRDGGNTSAGGAETHCNLHHSIPASLLVQAKAHKSNGIGGLQMLKGVNVTVDGNGNTISISENEEEDLFVWIKLDFGTLKRSTAVKKLMLLRANAGDIRMYMQVDAASVVNTEVDTTYATSAAVASESSSQSVPNLSQGKGDVQFSSSKKRIQPLFVFAPTLSELQAMIAAAHSGSTGGEPAHKVSVIDIAVDPMVTGADGATNVAGNNFGRMVGNTTRMVEFVPNAGLVAFSEDSIGSKPIDDIDRLHTEAAATANEAGGGDTSVFDKPHSDMKRAIGTERGLQIPGIVNSFWLIVCMNFAEVVIDLSHFVLLLVVFCVAPWRGVSLVVALLEPANRWCWRVGTKAVRMLTHTDAYMLEYRAGFATACNRCAKSFMHTNNRNGAYSSYYRTNYSLSDEFVRDVGWKVSASSSVYYYRNHDNLHRNLAEAVASMEQGMEINNLEKESWKPYCAIMKKLVKLLESNGAECSVLLNLLKRRIVLQDLLLKLWAFKTLINVEFLYSTPYNSMLKIFTTPPPPRASRNSASSATTTSASAGATSCGRNGNPTSATRTTAAKSNYIMSDVPPEMKGAIMALIWSQYKKLAAEIAQNSKDIHVALKAMENSWQDADIHHAKAMKSVSGLKKLRKNVKYYCGVFQRSKSESGKMIVIFAKQAAADLGFIVLFLFLVLTVVRVIPLVKDMIKHETYSILRFSTRVLMVKHVRGLAADLKNWGTFLGYFLLICGLMVGFPNFISEIWNHTHSIHAMNYFARRTIKDTLSYICELLMLFTAWKTYKIAITAVVYTTLVPAACIGEVLAVAWNHCCKRGDDLTRGRDYSMADHTLDATTTYSVNRTTADGRRRASQVEQGHSTTGTKIRFYCGLILFYLLFSGVTAATKMLNHKATVDYDNGQDGAVTDNVYETAIYVQFACGIAILCYIVPSVLITAFSPAYWRPAPTLSPGNITSSSFTWSHLLAILTPLLETAQLAAIVLFFYWDNTNPSNYAEVAGGGASSNAPSDTNNNMFITSLLLWNIGKEAYSNSMIVGFVTGITASLLISVPLAVSSGTSTPKKLLRWMQITQSPAFETLNVFLTRIFNVWIVATLLRPSGCAYSNSANQVNGDGDAYVAYYLSTSDTVLCGGIAEAPGDNDAIADNNRHWSSLVALPLLAYVMITTTILHSDSAELRLNSGKANSFVRFAPLYAIMMKAAQFAVVFVSFVGFNASDTVVPLCVIVAIVACLVIWNVYWLIRAARLGESCAGACSLVIVTPLRTVGLLCVLWAAELCMLRNPYADIGSPAAARPSWCTETVLYLGWAVLALLGIMWGLYVQHLENKRWAALVAESGVVDAVNSLVSISNALLVDDVVSLSTVSVVAARDFAGPTATDVDKQRYIEVVRNELFNTSGDGCGMGCIGGASGSGGGSVTSIALLAHSTLRLEDLVLTERLSHKFLRQRHVWRNKLATLYNFRHVADDTTFGDEGTGSGSSGATGRGSVTSSYQDEVFDNLVLDPLLEGDVESGMRRVSVNSAGPSLSVSSATGRGLEMTASSASTGATNARAEASQRNTPGTAVAPRAPVSRNSMAYALQLLRQQIDILQRGILSGSNNTSDIQHSLVSKGMLNILFKRKLPEDCVWMVYSYCFDVTSAKRAVGPLLARFNIANADLGSKVLATAGLSGSYHGTMVDNLRQGCEVVKLLKGELPEALEDARARAIEGPSGFGGAGVAADFSVTEEAIRKATATGTSSSSSSSQV